MSEPTPSSSSNLPSVSTAAATIDNNAIQPDVSAESGNPTANANQATKKKIKHPYLNMQPFIVYRNQEQQIVIPFNALPLEQNKFDGEWARVTQNILPFLTGKLYEVYDPFHTADIEERIKDGKGILKQLQKIGSTYLKEAINKKFEKKGKQSSTSQPFNVVGFDKIINNMVSEFNNDLIGTLEVLYDIVFATIDSEVWKEEAAREFMRLRSFAVVGNSLTSLNGSKKKHCFIKITHAEASKVAYEKLAKAMDKYFKCSLRKERGGDNGVAGWGILYVENVKSTRASSEIHVRLISENVHHRFLLCASPTSKKLTVDHLVAKLVEAGGKTGNTLDYITSLVKEQWDDKFGDPLPSLGYGPSSIMSGYDGMMGSTEALTNDTLALAAQLGADYHEAERNENADAKAPDHIEVEQRKENAKAPRRFEEEQREEIADAESARRSSIWPINLRSQPSY